MTNYPHADHVHVNPIPVDQRRSTRYGNKTSQGYTLEDLQRLRDWMMEHRLRPLDLMGHQPEEYPMPTHNHDEAVKAVDKAVRKLAEATDRHDKAEARMKRAKDRLAEAETAHMLTHYPEPAAFGASFITFKTSFGLPGGKTCAYAGVGVYDSPTNRTNWYLTGNRGHKGEAMTWAEVLEFAGRSGRLTLRVVTQTEPVVDR